MVSKIPDGEQKANKLLAEYDHNGNCVRDYIYFGDRLLAEYKPQTDEYFYYMTDQINSKRIITDGICG